MFCNVQRRLGILVSRCFAKSSFYPIVVHCVVPMKVGTQDGTKSLTADPALPVEVIASIVLTDATCIAIRFLACFWVGL